MCSGLKPTWAAVCSFGMARMAPGIADCGAAAVSNGSARIVDSGCRANGARSLSCLGRIVEFIAM